LFYITNLTPYTSIIVMQKNWVVKPPAHVEIVKKLSKELNINTVLANLLAQRGISTFEEAKRFFRPDISHLHNPFLMKDMDKAVIRIEQAFENNEKILVYGDYDVDGTTAVALMYSFLKDIYPLVDYYIPDRYKEGYGVSTAGIDWAKTNNYNLIICLDCGIKSVDKIDYANSLNIDFIICDHHLPGEDLPKAVAVLDPKRKDCEYPFKELCGCGVGFKLAQAYSLKHGIPFSNLEQYLDLVAVSIAADIVPIIDENRTFAYFGLKLLNTNPRHGIKAILTLSNFKRELTISDIVFSVGPRINAAGRIEDGKQAVALLITANNEDATFAGKTIDGHNTERRTLDTAITEQALQMLYDEDASLNRKSTVLFHPDWHKGVIGIVASRLTEKYYRPTIVLTESNGFVTGSARSVKDFDIHNAIEACSDFLEQFGGHKYAAGLTLKTENVLAFSQKFEEVVSSTITEAMLTPQVEIDAELNLSDITPVFYKILKQFAPFGPGNMAPIFKTSQVNDKGYARVVGVNHLKLTITKPDTNVFIDGIGFQLGDNLTKITEKQAFDVCYAIEENEWNGQISLQLNVKDIKQ
jgi:single-stranded-DNA-specific exonuclease